MDATIHLRSALTRRSHRASHARSEQQGSRLFEKEGAPRHLPIHVVHFDSVATYCTIGCTTLRKLWSSASRHGLLLLLYNRHLVSYQHTQHGISRASSARDRRCTTSFEPHESYPAALPHDLLLISRVLPQHLDGPGRADRPKRLRCLMAHLMREAIRGNQDQTCREHLMRGNQMQSEAIRGNQRQSRSHVPRAPDERQSDAIIINQKPSIRGNCRQSWAIRGNHQKQSEARRSNQMQS